MCEEMPCAPQDIAILKYTIPGTFGSFEKEEAAARVLFFSLKAEKWVGVSEQMLVDMMREDHEAYERACEVSRYKSEDLWRFERAMKRYYFFCALTLGLHVLFAEKPTLHQGPQIEQAPTSGIFIWGFGHVWKGIDALVECGMLRCEKINGEIVFFPTPPFIARILMIQRMQRCVG